MTPHSPALRFTANLLCLWGLCANASCRRAKGCKGNPDDCVTRYSPLAPEDARFGALATIQGGRDGASIEEVRLYEPAGLAALEAWVTQVRAAQNTNPGNGQPA
jgi:hypothetical protein